MFLACPIADTHWAGAVKVSEASTPTRHSFPRRGANCCGGRGVGLSRRPCVLGCARPLKQKKQTSGLAETQLKRAARIFPSCPIVDARRAGGEERLGYL